MSGFIFNGKHINEEFPNLKLVERSTPPPEDIPIKDSVIGMQGDYDFTIALFGERLYENRELIFVFNGKELNNSNKTFNKRMLENWLLSGSYMPLYDDKEHMHYYMARCVDVKLESDDGILKAPYTLTFDAYPFKIKKTIEGSPYWDDYDVSDYYQKTSFELRRTTFKSLPIGEVGTIGAWSTQYDGFESIAKQLLGQSYTITDKRTTSQSVSSYSYYLSGLNKWVIEQDIVQTQNGAQKIDLFNNGVASIIPKVTATGPITIIRGNEVFNLFTGVTESDLFRINVGYNHLVVASGTAADIKIEMHKEVI
ncbi:hypothetical protein LHA31_02510 [Carnobacterium viridans]|uniref:Phage tail protein n=1 Tax=Carnobacterium viridans TaxID=174587 RepID=A0A1H0XNH5_9LACT|nr:hypothetical protein [Carnobacterium viridans]UDE95669.1 hypothetical protein LHA31_02510 [Carnobacterium viridans]SDQ04465.1 hypothetical protein SAMN04487752_0324 [Carnobacterium viridans]SDQ54815.1 hypothetical protein SAMN04487752_2718 [Carnobacterium viridans]